MTIEVMKRLFPVVNLVKELSEDELAFLKKYIESTLANDFKDMFHHFLDAQIAFIEEEIKEKI